jgi:hypothetical protein
MKYAYAEIPKIQNKIKGFLKKNGYILPKSFRSIYDNKTVHAFVSPIQYKNKLYFIKIRTLTLDIEKIRFNKQLKVSQFLSQNPNLAINKYTAKLLDYGTSKNDGVDFMIYEYKKGANVGSRSHYGITRLKMSDIESLINIIIALLEIPTNVLSNLLKVQSANFYKDKMTYHKLSDKYNNLLTKISWNIFNTNNNYFSHGDFGPHNLMRGKDNLILTDFEDVSITNPYFDIATLWVYSFVKNNWREKLLKVFKVKHAKIINEDYLNYNLLIYTLIQIGFLLRYDKKVIKKYLWKRNNDLLELSKKLGLNITLKDLYTV